MRLAITIALFASLALTSLHAQTTLQARAFLDGIYSWDTNDEADDPLADAKVYSPSLIRLFALDRRRAKGDIGRLDFDPLCDCQDPGGIRYQIASLTSSGFQKAKAEVLLTNSPSGARWRRSLKFDLLWTNHGWRIYDVHTFQRPSLRTFLSQP